jgi:FtsP/CotA-like multicopper oxidase with cupredoxin domain
VVIDFSQFPVGSSVYLKEAAAQNVTGGGPALPDPAPGLPMANVLMRFDVVGNTIIPDTPPIPSTLVDLPPVPAAQSTFEWTFKLVGGRFKINDLEFDPNVPVHTVLKGSSEEWSLRNNVIAGAWVHPVHIHFEEGRMLERTLQTVPGGGPDTIVNVPLNGWEATDNARRDVYPLPGQNALKIRLAFRDFVGRYLIHCHNMNHEDAFMMVRWDIVDNMAALERARQDTIARRQAAGVDVEAGLPKEVKG